MIALLWAGLVLALLVTLAACGWMLVRAFIRLLEAFAELLAKPAILDGVHRSGPEERPLPAVLESRSVVAARYRELALARRDRREQRHRERLNRARSITTTVTTSDWFRS